MDVLTELIKSLSKNEKGYFKKYASRYGNIKNNIYIKLFDIIEKNPDTESEKIKKTFESKFKGNSYPVIKNYLYNIILKSLRAYYEEKNPTAEIHNQIQNFIILYNKALNKQAENCIEKIKQLSIQNEMPLYFIEANSRAFEIEIEKTNDLSNYQSTIKENYTEQLKLLELQREIIEYRQLRKKYFLLLANTLGNSTDDQLKLKELLKTELLHPNCRPAATESQLIYHYIRSSAEFNVFKNTENSIYEYRLFIKFFENNPGLISKEPLTYIICLHNYLQSLLSGKLFSEFEENIPMLLEFKSQNHNIEIKKSSCIISLKLSYYIFSSKIQEGLAFISKNLELIKSIKPKISATLALAIYDSVAILYFKNKNYSDSLRIVNEIIHDKSSIRKDIKCFARILYLMIHLELGNLDHVEYNLKSFQQFVEKNKGDNNYAWSMIKFFKKICENPNHITADNALAILLEELNYFKRNAELDRSVFQFFDLSEWVVSKINANKRPQ